jgi:hypothetical protein
VDRTSVPHGHALSGFALASTGEVSRIHLQPPLTRRAIFRGAVAQAIARALGGETLEHAGQQRLLAMRR